MPTNRLGAVEPGVEYAIKRETSVYMLLHTHIHTELQVESDALSIVIYILTHCRTHHCHSSYWEQTVMVRDTDVLLVTRVICLCCGQVLCFIPSLNHLICG